MSRPVISYKKLSETLSICERHRTSEHPQGFWIYDEVIGGNLAMGEPDRDKAFVEVITYYQVRFKETEKALVEIQRKVDEFVSQFIKDEDGDSRF